MKTLLYYIKSLMAAARCAGGFPYRILSDDASEVEMSSCDVAYLVGCTLTAVAIFVAGNVGIFFRTPFST
jgi:hypothetical protein